MSLWSRPNPVEERRVRDLETLTRHLESELSAARRATEAAQLDLRTKEAQRLRELRSAAEELTRERIQRQTLQAQKEQADRSLAIVVYDLRRARDERDQALRDLDLLGFEPEAPAGGSIPDLLRAWAARRPEGNGRTLLEQAAGAILAYKADAEREFEPGRPRLVPGGQVEPDLRARLAAVLADYFDLTLTSTPEDLWADILDLWGGERRQEALDVLIPFLAGDQAANVTLDRILRVLVGRPALPEVPEALAKLREMAEPRGAARAHELADQVALALEGGR